MIPSFSDIFDDVDNNIWASHAHMPKIAFEKDEYFDGSCELSWTENKFLKHRSLDIVLGDRVESNNDWAIYYYLPPGLMKRRYGHIRLSETDWCNRHRMHAKIYEIGRSKRAREGDPVEYFAQVSQICYRYYNVISSRHGIEVVLSQPDEDKPCYECSGEEGTACHILADAFEQYLQNLSRRRQVAGYSKIENKSKIDVVSFPCQRKPYRQLAAGGRCGKDIVMSDYDELQRVLQARCTKAASFLSKTDLTAWQVVTCSDPHTIKAVAASPSDYSAFPDLSLACLKKKSDQITLLLPFRGHIGTSINIWKPFWDIDKEFSVRISRPVDTHKGKPVYFDMDRAYFSLVQRNGRWTHKLEQMADHYRGPLTDFKRAADMFVQLLILSEAVDS